MIIADRKEIIYLYEKENVYLAEAAQMLIRNVSYEIPSLKKQIPKLEQIGNVIYVIYICIFYFSYITKKYFIIIFINLIFTLGF